MKLLKKWRNSNENDHGRGSALAKRQRHGDDRGIERFRREIDRTFDRFWREFDGGDPWSALTTLPTAFGNITDWPAVASKASTPASTMAG